MDTASEALFSLQPVSFTYKQEMDPAGTSQLGLVAEEVEKVSPNLVVRDKMENRTVCGMTRLTQCCLMNSSKNIAG